MPFGLTNAPGTFQHWINTILREGLDQFCHGYLDDIIIYSENLHDHRKHVRWVLERLKKAKARIKPSKCKFHTDTIDYLGFIVSPQGISMDPKKVSAVKEWKEPQNIKDIQKFLGFANFYRRFIKGYSRIISPMTELLPKDVEFKWGPRQQNAFDILKTCFTSGPVLCHYDPSKPCRLEADASDYVTAGILSQLDDQGILHPIAFFSKKMTPAEINYDIYDKEMLAIFNSFKHWRCFLEGAVGKVQVLCDHHNLQYFMTTKVLNQRQARWMNYLTRFDFEIIFKPGKQNTKADALTRRPGDVLEEGDAVRQINETVFLKPEQI